MILSLIAAISQNKVIGKDNRLPWHYPEDLKRFKAMTTDSTVIM
jgi:dihydrofolate reductase